MPMPKERKPHLLEVKQAVVALMDGEIARRKAAVFHSEGYGKEDIEERRKIAIWIKQRNRFAKEADIAELPLITKTNQGVLIWSKEEKVDE